MPISTLKNTSKTTLFMYVVALAGIVGVIYFGAKLLTNFDGFKKKSALTVAVYDGDASVYINDNQVGATPLSSKDIAPGENRVKIKNATREYNSQIDFIPNDQKYIHNVGVFVDLGVSETFSSVQEFWFTKDRSGEVLKIVSDPANAGVFIDNTAVGKTPYSSNQLSEGEYDLRIDYPGYETQTARINIKKGYALNIRFKLFPVPVPANINLLEGATDFYNLSLDNQAIFADTQDWVKATIYWNRTRGLNLAGTGLNKEPIFDYFLDYKGNLFDSKGILIANDEQMAALKEAKKGGYLGKLSNGAGITQEAKTTVLKMGSTGVGGKSATVLETGTGWLRVRGTPSLGGAELARVNVGQKYSVLEEQAGWVKIKVSETVMGWVSADYVKVE